ncbi:MAG: hypothetical protein E7Z92_01710 [Cyanobacteria bacterium SIG31]|nr:hypothetical protein [Cyanobacteria bacterium SIG31]
MIIPIFMIPTGHYEIICRLRQLGIQPTGNRDFDRELLVQAVKAKTEKIEEKKKEEEKRIEKNEAQNTRETLELERKGAEIKSLYNRIFLGL